MCLKSKLNFINIVVWKLNKKIHLVLLESGLYLHNSLAQKVPELELDQVWPSLTLYAYTDTCRSRVQPRERPGTHPNQSGTLKYPHFDPLHTPVAQTVQELELDQVLTLFTRTDTCRTRVRTRERPGTHPNQSGTLKYPHFDYSHASLAQTVQKLESNPGSGH